MWIDSPTSGSGNAWVTRIKAAFAESGDEGSPGGGSVKPGRGPSTRQWDGRVRVSTPTFCSGSIPVPKSGIGVEASGNGLCRRGSGMDFPERSGTKMGKSGFRAGKPAGIASPTQLAGNSPVDRTREAKEGDSGPDRGVAGLARVRGFEGATDSGSSNSLAPAVAPVAGRAWVVGRFWTAASPGASTGGIRKVGGVRSGVSTPGNPEENADRTRVSAEPDSGVGSTSGRAPSTEGLRSSDFQLAGNSPVDRTLEAKESDSTPDRGVAGLARVRGFEGATDSGFPNSLAPAVAPVAGRTWIVGRFWTAASPGASTGGVREAGGVRSGVSTPGNPAENADRIRASAEPDSKVGPTSGRASATEGLRSSDFKPDEIPWFARDGLDGFGGEADSLAGGSSLESIPPASDSSKSASTADSHSPDVRGGSGSATGGQVTHGTRGGTGFPASIDPVSVRTNRESRVGAGSASEGGVPPGVGAETDRSGFRMARGAVGADKRIGSGRSPGRAGFDGAPLAGFG